MAGPMADSPQRGFALAEYAGRVARAQGLMADQGLAGLLLTTEAEVRRRLPGEDGAVVTESLSLDAPFDPGEITFLWIAMPFLAGVKWGMIFSPRTLTNCCCPCSKIPKALR